jgi:hypothetical protein
MKFRPSMLIKMRWCEPNYEISSVEAERQKFTRCDNAGENKAL